MGPGAEVVPPVTGKEVRQKSAMTRQSQASERHSTQDRPMTTVTYSVDNPLLRWIAERRIWIVEEPFDAVWGDITVAIEQGFETDLASIPRLFRSLIPQVGRHIQAAIVHDKIYRTTGHGITRAQADDMFLDGMEAKGVGWLRRRTIYAAVRVGGWASWTA